MRYTREMPQKKEYFSFIWQTLDTLFRILLLPRTLRNNQNLGNPKGVIISDHLLKFHPEDQREKIRDQIVASQEN